MTDFLLNVLTAYLDTDWFLLCLGLGVFLLGVWLGHNDSLR